MIHEASLQDAVRFRKYHGGHGVAGIINTCHTLMHGEHGCVLRAKDSNYRKKRFLSVFPVVFSHYASKSKGNHGGHGVAGIIYTCHTLMHGEHGCVLRAKDSNYRKKRFLSVFSVVSLTTPVKVKATTEATE